MAAVKRRRYKLRVKGALGWKTVYVSTMRAALYHCRRLRSYGIPAYWRYT